MTQRQHRFTAFEARSLMLIASVTLGVAGSAYAQSTAAPAAPATPAPAAAPATPASDAEITAAFTKADKNSDGKLSREEAATLPAVAVSFDRIDSNKDGSVSSAEFAKAMKM